MTPHTKRDALITHYRNMALADKSLDCESTLTPDELLDLLDVMDATTTTTKGTTMTTLQEALIAAALDASSRGLISGTTNWAAFVATSIGSALEQQGEQPQSVAVRYKLKGDLNWQYTENAKQPTPPCEIEYLYTAAPAPQPAQLEKELEFGFEVAPQPAWKERIQHARENYLTFSPYSVEQMILAALQSAQPVAAQPLSSEKLNELWISVAGTACGYGPFARAIEAAHGISDQGASIRGI